MLRLPKVLIPVQNRPRRAPPRTPPTMPQHKSAEKRVRQNAKRRARNRWHKTRMRTMIKKLENTQDKAEAEALLREVKAVLDRLATKRIIPPNRAAEKKSRLERMVNAL